jgi:hypothetical protein
MLSTWRQGGPLPLSGAGGPAAAVISTSSGWHLSCREGLFVGWKLAGGWVSNPFRRRGSCRISVVFVHDYGKYFTVRQGRSSISIDLTPSLIGRVA